MYNSLLVCGNPIVYFEIDYSVTVGMDGKDNQYEFNFNKLRVINTIIGKTTQTKNLNIKRQITMKPMWDLREFAGIVEKQKAKEDVLTILMMMAYLTLVQVFRPMTSLLEKSQNLEKTTVLS